MSQLSKLTAPQLKEILKTHKKHHDIKYSKMKKAELVAAMDPIFEVKDGQVHKRSAGASGPRETPGKKTRDDRPSPSESASDFPAGHTKKGNDGREYEVKADKNGRKSWKLTATKMPKAKANAYNPARDDAIISPDRFDGPEDVISKATSRTCVEEKKEIERLRKQLKECRQKLAAPKAPARVPKEEPRARSVKRMSPIYEEPDSGDDVLDFNRIIAEIEDLIDDFKSAPSMNALNRVDQKLEGLNNTDARDAMIYLARNVVKVPINEKKLDKSVRLDNVQQQTDAQRKKSQAQVIYLDQLQDSILDKLEKDANVAAKKKIDKPLSKTKSPPKAPPFRFGGAKKPKSPVSKGNLLKQMDKIENDSKKTKKAKACIDDYKEKLKKNVTLGKKLGAGQNGAVYTLCEGPNCGQYVVKESILASTSAFAPDNPKLLEMQFMNEVKCLQGLQGFKAEYKGKKWVCTSKLYGSGICYNYDGQDKIGYIIMEASKPVPKNLSDQQRCKLMKEVDACFFSLLKAGWVHLDSHHENYMLNDEGLPVIIDWGYGWNVNWGQITKANNYVANQHEHTDGYYFSDIADEQWRNLRWLRNEIKHYCRTRDYSTDDMYIQAITALGKKAYGGNQIVWRSPREN